MRKITVAAVSAVVGFSLACGGGMPSAPLASPWTDMSLPVGSGNVLYSDATSTTVNYDGGSVTDLGKQYSESLKTWGCAESFAPMESADSYTWSCTKDSKNYTLAVTSGAGMLVVGLSTY